MSNKDRYLGLVLHSTPKNHVWFKNVMRDAIEIGWEHFKIVRKGKGYTVYNHRSE